MWIVNNRKIFYIISAVLVGASLLAVGIWGLRLGVEFTGGALLEVVYAVERPTPEVIRPELDKVIKNYTLQATGEKGYIIRTGHLDSDQRDKIIEAFSLEKSLGVTQQRFDQIGPTIGREASYKALLSIVLVVLLIVLFIAFAFRKVSEPVSSWKYGVIAVVALLHDVIVPVGVFAVLGHFMGIEVGTLFVTALLVVLGFSVHDTIVVFDRVRENLKLDKAAGNKKSFTEIVGESISQTFTRSINTSMTVIITLLALYFFGGESIRYFILALLVGIIAGTYSSIFLGSPLLVTVEKWQHKK